MTITEISIKRPSLIIVIFSALTIIGLYCYSLLQYELLPKITPPIVTIMTPYPGASPSEVEKSVSRPIEDAVSTIDKVVDIHTRSQEGLSMITIELEQDANVDVALQDAQRKVNALAATFPADVKTPMLGKIKLDETPILRIGVTSEEEPRAFYQFVKDYIQPRLSNIEGVGQIVTVGGEAREIKINLDMPKIRALGISIMQVTQAIKAANLDYPTGKIKDRDGQFIVRLAGKFQTIEEIGNLIVGVSRQGGQIKLKDIAEIQDGYREYERISRLNGVNSIGLLIVKQAEANAVEVAQKVKKELQVLEQEYAKIKLHFDIAQDASYFTVAAADAVKFDLMLAVLLVAAVMFVFLHSLRNSIIVMIAIPTSLISTFIAMWLFNFSLNLMTLLALSLVIGILVDDSIVVLENIYRHLEMGKDSRTAALEGRNEIGFTALSITLVDVVVFFPLAVLTGIVGNIMREFSITVVVSTLMSLFVSFTITPMLASRFSKLQKPNNSLWGKMVRGFEEGMENFKKTYAEVLSWCLKHPWITTAIALVLFFSALSLPQLGLIGREFMTYSDRGEFSVMIELAPGVRIEQTNQVSQKVEAMLATIPEVEKIYANVGAASEGFLDQSSNNISEIIVTLKDKKERARSTDEVITEVKDRLLQMPGVKARVNPVGIFGTANFSPIQLVVSGPDYNSVMVTARKIQNLLAQIPGTSDVRLSVEEGKPEMRIDIDREKMALYGLTMAEVGATLNIALRGDDKSTYRDGNTDYDIRITLDEYDKSKTEKLEEITFTNRLGQIIPLSQFANISFTTGPSVLQRENRNPAVTILSQAIGRPSGDIAAELDAKMANFKLPEGVKTKWLGDIKNQNESGESMGIAMAASIIFVYLIMVALYDSFIYPLVVLFSIPLATIGAFYALGLTMSSLSIFTMLGLIMQGGLVAKNAILLVDFTNHLKAKGFKLREALIEAGQERLRPILMTTLSMIIGMLPIALAKGAASEWKNGLAWVLIGGLTSSMFLTLVFVPVVYQAADKIVYFLKNLKYYFIKKPRIEEEVQPLGETYLP
ncbi:MAG: efflux RND transporter permease subunit [Bacteroidia bacterium]|nr:efflux RND transporter permease subunit [Bacteroidia bacterium]MDW8158117.1 efflux RND transporter permease subunit [Bacteroidia bacterium]